MDWQSRSVGVGRREMGFDTAVLAGLDEYRLGTNCKGLTGNGSRGMYRSVTVVSGS